MEKVLLTPEQFEDMASTEMDCVNVLKPYKKIIDFTPSPNSNEVKGNPSFYYAQVYEVLELMFVGLQKVIKDLEDNAFILYNTTDRAELEALGVVIISEQTEKETIAASVTQQDELEHTKAVSLYESNK